MHKLKKKLYLLVVRYFQVWANYSLRRWHPRVIAITGSVGKTTMLGLMELQLGGRAHYSHNANSAYGICFDILGMTGITGSKLKWLYLFVAAPLRSLWFRHRKEFYVVEIDGERPNETQLLAKWLQPEVTIWVSVGRTHAVYYDEQVKSGQFATVEEAIVHEFASLPRQTRELVIFDGDNAAMKRSLGQLKTVKTASVDSAALETYAVWPDKTDFVVGKQAYHFTQPMPREVYLQLAMLGKLAAYLKLEPVHDLAAFVQPPGRSNFLRGKKGIKLIDSTCNAHLMSMQSIIELFREMQTTHKWIVIGDIVEQGEAEAEEHAKLGALLKQTNFERYILVGRRTQKYSLPEMNAVKTVSFLQPKDALAYLKAELNGGETVLFKGSQYLEGVVEQLLEDPEDAKYLPRQEPAAKRRRAQWGLR